MQVTSTVSLSLSLSATIAHMRFDKNTVWIHHNTFASENKNASRLNSLSTLKKSLVVIGLKEMKLHGCRWSHTYNVGGVSQFCIESEDRVMNHDLASFPGPTQLSVACSMENRGESGIFSHMSMM